MSSYEYKALSLSKKMAHSTTVTPLFRASSFTSLSLISSCIFASALRCSSRWIPKSCKGSDKCNNGGRHEASNKSKVEEPELVPDKLPPPVACTLPGFRERRGEGALDEPPPGKVSGTFLGGCWGIGSKTPFGCMLNDFFKGELGMGYTNVRLGVEYGTRGSRTLFLSMDIFLVLLIISLASVSLVDTGIPDA